MTKKRNRPLKKLDPFELYEAAVVDARSDVRFFRKIFLESFEHYPETYREDFSGAFKHAVEWVKCNRRNQSWAVDLDEKPLEYGKKTHLSKLSDGQKARVHIRRGNVLRGVGKQVDFITAMNFSYCIFKERRILKQYFKSVFQSLNTRGLFLLDVMGGSQMMEASVDRSVISATRRHPKLTYFWEQFNFDPVTSEAKFAIHFKLGNSKRRLKNVFTYDWRLWTLPELRDLMLECGFKKTYVYWEGTHRNGAGNGVFRRDRSEEGCLVWIAYLIGEKAP